MKTDPIDWVAAITHDYAHFPHDQTYSLYAEDVFFQDPLTRFRGVNRYRSMIAWMDNWFREIKLDLLGIEQTGSKIETQWILSWTAPLPWRPRLQIRGWTEMHLNEQGFIAAHLDYWHSSPWQVVQQVFVLKGFNPSPPGSP